MKERSAPRCALLALAALLASSAGAQENAEWREWNRPVAPFRIFGPLYYVGASDITAFAIATSEGVILLDGGFPLTAPQILRNLETLGLGIDSVELLLNSHAHVDHAGGLAELKAKSGARLVASAGDAPLLEAGGKGDFAFGDSLPYPPVHVDRIVRDGESVTLGGVTLTAQVTAGHTKGCTTWTATFDAGGTRRDAVFVCSTTRPGATGYELVDNAAYPAIAADFEATFARLRELPCELFLASHGYVFDLDGKSARLRAGTDESNPFLDAEGYRAYVETSERSFRAALAEARSAAAASSAAPTTSTNSPGSEGRPPSSADSSDSRP